MEVVGNAGKEVVRLPNLEKGQGITEYALIFLVIAIVVLVVLSLIGPDIGNVFSNLVTNF